MSNKDVMLNINRVEAVGSHQESKRTAVLMMSGETIFITPPQGCNLDDYTSRLIRAIEHGVESDSDFVAFDSSNDLSCLDEAELENLEETSSGSSTRDWATIGHTDEGVYPTKDYMKFHKSDQSPEAEEGSEEVNLGRWTIEDSELKALIRSAEDTGFVAGKRAAKIFYASQIISSLRAAYGYTPTKSSFQIVEAVLESLGFQIVDGLEKKQ